jgi:hypothetical protein
LDEEILSSWDTGVLRIGVDFLEITQVLQPRFTRVDAVLKMSPGKIEISRRHLSFVRCCRKRDALEKTANPP